ncbi:hypothetical protein [Verrucomicrobium sp. BvORR034]|uniref:hypothetical protein n=1 Tax=Verrucomicrobium sp. BvORR034 TaxID=1396418 RepID=UPI000678EF90|nr:hypothetical protein [Verrucomicrobium sp. BvORR034]
MSSLSLPVLRQPHGLTWVGVVEKMDRRLKRESLQLHLEPFPQKLPGRRSPFVEIHAAWQALTHARRNTATLRALLTVLRQTYGPPALASRPLPALDHARDIRPWLNDPACVRQLLLELAPWWGEAVARETTPPPVPTAALVADPLLHYHAHLTVDLEDSCHIMLYAPLLILALPSGTSTRQSAALLQCLARTPLDLTSRQTALHLWACRHGAGWQRTAQLAHPVHTSTNFLELAHASGLLNQPCPPGMDHLLQYLKRTHTPDWTQPLTLLTKGLEPRTVVGWLRLRAAGLPVPDPDRNLLCQPHYRPLRKLLPRVLLVRTMKKKAARDQVMLSERLWEAASRLEGFGEVLESIRPGWWPQHHLARLLIKLADIWRCRRQHPDLIKKRWSRLRPVLPSLIRTLEQTPLKMRLKALEVFASLLVNTGMQPARELVEVTPTLIRTLTASSCNSSDVAEPLGCLFRRLPPSSLQQVAENQPLLAHLEKASRTCSYRWWVVGGCMALRDADANATLYLPLLQHCPGRFVTFLHALGTLPEHARKEVWQMFQEHPLVSCNPGGLDLDRLIPLLDATAEDGEKPVPDKLRAHHAGSITLADHVLAHYRYEAWVETVKMQARVLLDLAACCQRRSFPAVRNAPAVDFHSLLMARSVTTRRRTLNRTLRMVADQPAATLHHHPANARWLQTLPPQVREHWQSGFEVERTLTKEGTVRLALEHNLQEKLKLGTYAKSCLAPGGAWDKSAVAVALDVNKHVLYARNSEQKVVGRQLIAISSNLRLVCFEVYPARCSAELKSLFATYDLALAQYLGLPLHRSGEYEIEQLHGLDWYDDEAMLQFV